MQLLSGPTFQAGRSVSLGLYIKKETWVVAESAVWLQSCIIVMYGDSGVGDGGCLYMSDRHTYNTCATAAAESSASDPGGLVIFLFLQCGA